MNNKADLLIFGNVITVDEHKPFAEAVAIKEDKILYVGSKEVAMKLAGKDTKIFDYGSNSVYPGFLEAHCHPGGAGYQMFGVAHLDRDADIPEWVEAMRKYVEAHPNKEIYNGFGFLEKKVTPTAKMLDEVCPDKPMVITDASGHCAWLNTKAMERFGIDEEAVKRWGTSYVRVDADGKPIGIVRETPVFHIRAHTVVSLSDMVEAVSAWQNFALSQGYTGAYNAGVNLLNKEEPLAFQQLEKEGKLKLYSYGGYMVGDNTDTPEKDIDKIALEAERHNSRHYRLIGAKVFCDGVTEGYTAWMLDDYEGRPGDKGAARFGDHDKMVALTVAAAKHNLNVHVHTIGDAAIRAWIDAFAEAEEITGDFDQRNALAHLQCIHPEDIKRMADYNIIAVDGMMWRMKTEADYWLPMKAIGQKRIATTYPLKSFLDAGVVLVSHSDFPVSPVFGAAYAICIGSLGYQPSYGKEFDREDGQCISRLEALKALTINVAYSWHEETHMGSLEIGKLANIAVFDKDFLHDDFAEVEKAKCLATFIDGELVYQA